MCCLHLTEEMTGRAALLQEYGIGMQATDDVGIIVGSVEEAELVVGSPLCLE